MTRLEREYDDFEEIGRGGFGIVYRARCIAKGKSWSGTDVAIKKIDITRAPAYRVELELEALSRLVHDNIVKFYEQFQENGSQYIIMEYCKHRSLRDYVKKNGKMSDFSAAYILRQLVSAVKHIHENNMIHRDLSAGNVLISSIREDKLFVKLADFGLATTFRKGDIARTMLGTPGYIAPQVYDRHYNQKADVYSLGGILYLMLTGEDPPRDREVNPFKLPITPQGAVLIQSMMDPNEERRIHLGDVTMSDFMRKVDGLSLPMSRSRETSREKPVPWEYHITHHSPIRIRAHSAQPTTSGYKRVTKDSAFESGESNAHAYRRRRSVDRYHNGPSAGITDCRHSTYVENECIRCGRRQSLETRFGRETEVRELNGSKRSSRADRRQAVQIAPIYANPKKIIKGAFGDRRNKLHPGFVWPIDVSRLAPAVTVRKAGRFTFNKNGTIVYEATIRNRSQSVSRNRTVSDEQLVKWIAVVEKTTNGTQIFSVYQPIHKCAVPSKEMPLLPVDPKTRRTYSSIDELQHATDKVDEIALALYRKILDEINLAGARAVKIVFKPSCNCTARLMENGDFRVKFQDGRLALLKKSSDSVTVTKDDRTPDGLSEEETIMFENAYKDALLLETFLQETPFQIVKPFPFHFSNSSQFITNEMGETKIANFTSQQTGRMVFSERLADANQPFSSKKCHSTDYISKHARAPLRERNVSSVSKNSNYDVEIIQKPIGDASSSSPENVQSAHHKVRVLAEGEYTLRGQLDKTGVQIPTRIILNGSTTARELRISSNDPKIFVFKENGHEKRFRFDGISYADVPATARDLLYTLYQKRRKLKESLNYASINA